MPVFYCNGHSIKKFPFTRESYSKSNSIDAVLLAKKKLGDFIARKANSLILSQHRLFHQRSLALPYHTVFLHACCYPLLMFNCFILYRSTMTSITYLNGDLIILSFITCAVGTYLRCIVPIHYIVFHTGLPYLNLIIDLMVETKKEPLTQKAENSIIKPLTETKKIESKHHVLKITYYVPSKCSSVWNVSPPLRPRPSPSLTWS